MRARGFPFVRYFSSQSLVVPTLDLTPYWTGSDAGKRKLADQINQACTDIGFITITGHRVSQKVQDEIKQKSLQYFDLPVEEKKKIIMTREYPYGYSGVSGETLARGHGKKTAAPDLKESFTVGPHNPKAQMPAVLLPDRPAGFGKAVQVYYREMENFSVHLLRCFALALKLDEHWFDQKADHHRSALRILNYPQQTETPLPGQIRAGEHTDYGSVTILMQDDVGGLQVKNREGKWVDVVNTPNSFIINLGDLMQRWTNDKWVSTPHRVINSSPKRRQSIAFFHNMNADLMVECIPTCLDGKPPKYPPINAWDHLIQKHTLSQNY